MEYSFDDSKDDFQLYVQVSMSFPLLPTFSLSSLTPYLLSFSLTIPYHYQKRVHTKFYLHTLPIHLLLSLPSTPPTHN